MFTDPIKNLKQFGLREDMILVDLGAGTGFYSIAAAQMLTRGKVYAIEIIKDFMASISRKAKDLHLKNIECIWGNVEKIGGTNIGDGIADAVIASNIFSQIQNKDKFISEIKRILKTNGKVLVIDWSSIFFKEASLESKITKDGVIKIFLDNKFSLDREIDAGSTHYGIIFKKQ